ncbi:SPARC-related modular calcium-binding protein 1 isoform X3 [Hemitrygon akajei]|uniref:SPARC-related modular calcium-binding protein 1 isoform X3 n=1 Tax=Hypanus sabinus TaxID=79690 RepID=UPI0028C45535|nr:SPARC-related modular calcium-binding protein 1 isoform X3 [Hypanus sabinus]
MFRKFSIIVPSHLMLLFVALPFSCSQRSGGPKFLIGDRDQDLECNVHCSSSQLKPLCVSDGRTYESRCDFQRAKCRDPTLEITHRGRCKETGPTKCRTERAQQAQEQAKKPQEPVFIPECNEDGSFAQVQCHTFTGYCWCVTPDGKPVSGSSVKNQTPVCSGSVTDKPSGPSSSGRKEDVSKPTPTAETQPVFDGDEITAPTLWIKQLVSKDSKHNGSSMRVQDKPSCDQERQAALEETHQYPRDGIFIPECAGAGLYKPVQCHQSTGYCWCVLVDIGRPIPGTSTRYQTPNCDSNARSKLIEGDDPFKDKELQGCPGAKKLEFITSVLDALTTDMVQAINSPAPATGGRFPEPDPSHTLEERVVHWYFGQLDKNGSNNIHKKEMKPFKRFLRKKAKPKKCGRKFTDYCDLNEDKTISLHELKGCLGVKEGGSSVGGLSNGRRQGANPFIGRLV